MGGIGGLLRSRGGAVLGAFAGSCYNHPIYALEIKAIEKGLKMAVELNCRKVQVLSDSLQAIEVIKGIQNTPWLVKEEVRLIGFYGNGLDDWSSSNHVFREVNKPADFLAYFAQDGIPDELKLLVVQDTRGCTYYRVS